MTVVEDYQAQTEALATTTAAQVAAIYAAVLAGQLTTPDAELLIAAAVNSANAAATTLADVFISAQIEEASGIAAPPVGLLPRDDSARLIKAAHTILDGEALSSHVAEPDKLAATFSEDGRKRSHEIDRGGFKPPNPDIDPPRSFKEPSQSGVVSAEPDPAATASMRLERLARSEPLETAQQAAVAAIAEQPLTQGWTRGMDADPCQLCVWWWREGRIWPKAHPFQSHKGCNCQPKVVLAENIQSTEYTRKLERSQQ